MKKREREALIEIANILEDRATELYEANTTNNKWDASTDTYRAKYRQCLRLAKRLRKQAANR